MNELVKVSVIMPSLNVVNYIEESVQSACDQVIRGIEIICIDAGSTDGTWEILERIADTDNRITLLKSEKRSYGYQVNLGMEKASGEYIAILETDDFVSEEMYGTLYEKAKEYNLDYVKSDYIAYWTQEGGERYLIRRKALQNDALYDLVLCPHEYAELATDDWYLWNGIYKREFLMSNSIRFSETDGAAFQDIGFLYQTLTGAEQAMYVHGKYYYYCIDREDASSNVGKDLIYAYQEYRRLYGGLH